MQAVYTPPTPLELAKIEAVLTDLMLEADYQAGAPALQSISDEEFEDYLARTEEALP